MAKKVTTLFISDDSLNLLEVEGKQIKQWASAPLEPGLVKEGLIQDESRVSDELANLAQAAKITSRRVIAGIGGLNSLYRMVSLPSLPDGIVPEAVKQEARRVIPLPMEETYLSYQRLSTTQDEVRVFLAAFPRNVADALHRTLQQAGFTPYIMELAPLALSRVPDIARAIIINLHQDTVDIIVLSEGLPQPIRTLSLAGEAASLQERLPAISEEIDRTVAFYNSSNKDNPLDSSVPILVSGELAAVPDSWPVLSGKLECPVSALVPPLEAPESFNPQEYMVNIGLALREIPMGEGTGRSMINVSALPKTQRPRRVNPEVIIYPVAIALGLAGLYFVWNMGREAGAEVAALKAQFPPAIEAEVAQARVDLDAIKAEAAAATAEWVDLVGPIEARAAVFDTTYSGLEFQRYSVDEEMNEAVKLQKTVGGGLRPPEIDLYRVTDDDNGIILSGRAIDREDIGLAQIYEFIFNYAKDLAYRFGDVTVLHVALVEGEEEEERVPEILYYDFELLVRR